MVRYVKFRFTEVKGVLGRPRLPPSISPRNCTHYDLAQVRGSHAAVIQCVFVDAAVVPPRCPCDVRLLRGYPSDHLPVFCISTSRVYVVVDQASIDVSSPTSSRTHSAGAQYSNIFLIVRRPPFRDSRAERYYVGRRPRAWWGLSSPGRGFYAASPCGHMRPVGFVFSTIIPAVRGCLV